MEPGSVQPMNEKEQPDKTGRRWFVCAMQGKARQISEPRYGRAMNVQDGIKPQPMVENMTKEHNGWIENSQEQAAPPLHPQPVRTYAWC